MPPPVIPDILKNSNWQSSKGNIAKLAGETGVGAAMNALQSAMAQVDLVAVSPTTQYKDMATLETAEKAAKTAMSKLAGVSAAAYKLRDVAKAAAEKYGKNPLIPKTAAAHAKAVQAAADQYGVAVRSYDPGPAFEQARKAVQSKLDIAISGLQKYIIKLRHGVDTFKNTANPTFDQWQKFWTETMRGLGAAIANVPETKPQSANWLPITKDSFKGANLSGPEIKKRAAIVEIALHKLEAAMP